MGYVHVAFPFCEAPASIICSLTSSPFGSVETSSVTTRQRVSIALVQQPHGEALLRVCPSLQL